MIPSSLVALVFLGRTLVAVEGLYDTEPECLIATDRMAAEIMAGPDAPHPSEGPFLVLCLPPAAVFRLDVLDRPMEAI